MAVKRERKREEGCKTKTTRRWFNVKQFEKAERHSLEESMFVLEDWKNAILEWSMFQRENGLQTEDRHLDLMHRAATAVQAIEDVLEFGGTMVPSDAPPAPPDMIFDIGENGEFTGLTLRNMERHKD